MQPVTTITTIQNILELEKCQNYVWIYDNLKTYQYRQILQQYQQNQQSYRVVVDFHYYNTSLEWKTHILELINGLNINHKVSTFKITINNQNPIDEQIIRLINARFVNLYRIEIQDQNDQTDSRIHNEIKELVMHSTLIHFQLLFWDGNLCCTDEGLQLTKEYNQIISRKQYLKYLHYENRWNSEDATSRQEIEQLIGKFKVM